MSLAAIRNLLTLTAMTWASPPALALQPEKTDIERRDHSAKEKCLACPDGFAQQPLFSKRAKPASVTPGLNRQNSSPHRKAPDSNRNLMRNKTIYNLITTTRIHWLGEMDNDS